MTAAVSRPIRAVLFDVDGTLYHQQPLRALMMAEIAAAAILTPSISRVVTLARVLRTYRAIHEEMRTPGLRPDSLAEFQIKETATRLQIDEQAVRRLIAEWMFQRPLKYLPWCRRRGLRSLLATLKRRGISVGTLSDYPAREKLAALGVASFVSPVLCTTDADVNALKPDPRGFWRACEIWNIPPDEVLYVGDRPDVDARGAHAAGLQCVVISAQRARRQSAIGAEHNVVRRLREVCFV